jgi:Fe-S-cluster containining protein
MKVSTFQKECRRCGTCCLKGGPALHPEDLPLLQDNFLHRKNLITIREGEPLLFLAGKNQQPAPTEIIKIKGSGTDWTCMFFARKSASCRIYNQRPLECSLLQCWDTTELENVAGKNLLTRYDIIDLHDPVRPFIKEQKIKCPLDMLGHLLHKVTRKKDHRSAMVQLANLVNADLAIRSQAYENLRFSLDLELFYFGRPLFVILKQFGMGVREEHGNLTLHVSSA